MGVNVIVKGHFSRLKDNFVSSRQTPKYPMVNLCFKTS